MTRLLVHVEGQTEETFVNEILREYLVNHGYHHISARLLGNARQRTRRGGIRSWAAAKKDLLIHLKQDPGCVVTTMVDYYGLPSSGDKAWPGRAMAASLPVPERGTTVQTALLADLSSDMGPDFDTRRFVPFVVVHEFEALLFSDCTAFASAIGRPALEPKLREIRNQFQTPEEINDSPITAPSKRVEELVPGYDKPLGGTLAVLEIGLQRIREACPHFRSWLEKLEALGG